MTKESTIILSVLDIPICPNIFSFTNLLKYSVASSFLPSSSISIRTIKCCFISCLAFRNSIKSACFSRICWLHNSNCWAYTVLHLWSSFSIDRFKYNQNIIILTPRTMSRHSTERMIWLLPFVTTLNINILYNTNMLPTGISSRTTLCLLDRFLIFSLWKNFFKNQTKTIMNIFDKTEPENWGAL